MGIEHTALCLGSLWPVSASLAVGPLSPDSGAAELANSPVEIFRFQPYAPSPALRHSP
jgi:hypothetical protein